MTNKEVNQILNSIGKMINLPNSNSGTLNEAHDNAACIGTGSDDSGYAGNTQKILDAIPIALVIVRVRDNQILYVNQKCCEVFKVSQEDCRGQISPNFWLDVADREEYTRQFRLQGFMKDYETRMKRPDGESFWALVSSALIECDGEAVTISGVLDIQKRKNLELKIAESEVRFRTIVETVPLPIIITRVADNVIMYVNEIAAEVFGFTNEEAYGQKAVSFYVNPAERAVIEQEIKRSGRVHNQEVRLKNNKGKITYALMSGKMISVSGEDVMLFGFQDITAMKMMEQELRRLATTDFLTNVANRRHWLEQAEQEFVRYKRYGNVSSVLVMDLDYFKLINDKYGHQMGDEVLKNFSAQCQTCLREVDFMGRIGGEEFAILLPETERNKAEIVARKIQEAILPVQLSGIEQAVSYTVSIGITQFEAADNFFSQALSRADSAMYTAKQEGRNRVVVK